ncbi:helix-turn-helix domain-containing protein [Streptomyces sp. NPDC056909]|uniref:helix-turn-helix domain-containing protein n=1 Tax=Streptomyces sp. NPDC056909 TaxID=3345963 RepID=UPI0036943509
MAGIDKIIGDRIERGRRRRGLYQHELAAAVGRSESWVGQVERGDAQPERAPDRTRTQPKAARSAA